MRILLVAYDNDSYISWFPQGLAYIASVCLKAGHEVKIIWSKLEEHEEMRKTLGGRGK